MKCEKCGKRKISTTLYHVHDTGLNYYKKIKSCKKCYKEAKKRAKSYNTEVLEK